MICCSDDFELSEKELRRIDEYCLGQLLFVQRKTTGVVCWSRLLWLSFICRRQCWLVRFQFTAKIKRILKITDDKATKIN